MDPQQVDPQTIVAALFAHQWLLLGALTTPLIVAALKQRSLWIAAHVPAWAIPWCAVGVGVLSVGSADVVAGKSWRQALFDGLASGVLAVFAHQTVVEGARKGKELIPAKAPPEAAKEEPAPASGPAEKSPDDTLQP